MHRREANWNPMKMKIKHSGPKTGWPGLAGMTLVEVVVALAITGVAVGGIISGYTFCTASSQRAALSLAASARAMERIEETRGAIWAPDRATPVDQLIAANFTNKAVMLDMSGAGNGIVPATIQTEITPVTITPAVGTKYTFKRIRVNCIWSFKGSQMFTNSIETDRAADQ